MSPNDPRPEHIPALEGIEFSADDYAGFWRRIVASVIDLIVLFVIYVVLFNVWLILAGPPWFTGHTFAFAIMIVAALYVGPLKRSWLRTVGYRVARVRIVNLRGARPSLTIMLLRSGLYMLGTGFALIDFAWLPGQRPRQKLSDLISGTYVVRARAIPTGHGEIVSVYYAMLCHFWIFREVRTISKIPDLVVQGGLDGCPSRVTGSMGTNQKAETG